MFTSDYMSASVLRSPIHFYNIRLCGFWLDGSVITSLIVPEKVAFTMETNSPSGRLNPRTLDCDDQPNRIRFQVAFSRSISFSTCRQTFSTLNPYFRMTMSPGADAPN
jgi:hypothetical protein